MSKLKDLVKYGKSNSDLDHRISTTLDNRKGKRRWRKHLSEVIERCLGHFYDLIVLFTLATVAAILLKLFLN